MRKINKTQFNRIKKQISTRYRQYQYQIIAGVLAVFALLFVASIFFKSDTSPEETAAPTPLSVNTLPVDGHNITQDTVGTIINHSTITLVAQTAGPVNHIGVTTGQYVSRGAWIATQETAYNSGNASSITRQIAAKNQELATESLQNTAATVSKNRELADKNRDNTDELRKISEESIDQTKTIIDNTKTIIDKIKSDIDAASDPDIIQGLRQQLVSYQSSLSQTESSLRNLEYSTDTDNPPTKLADINKDLVYLSTEIQLKSAQIQKDIADLNLKAARITEAMSTVSAPFAGTIEKLHVDLGQYLTPGTPVATLKGGADLQVITNLSGQTAAKIDTNNSITLTINNTPYQITDFHVTAAPTNGQLYQLIATLPDFMANLVTEGQTVELTLPLDANGGTTDNLYVPLDAVFTTNTSQFVYLLQNGATVKRNVELGNIIGSQIHIKSGLTNQDIIILDRRVTEGQTVTEEN